MASPLVGHFTISTEDNSEIRVKGIKLGDSFSTEAGGIVVHLLAIQEVGIRSLYYHGMVIIRG